MILTALTAIVLDEKPLSLLTLRFGHAQGDTCKAWMLALEAGGHRFFVPEIADYELRRELIRANKGPSLARLDAFNAAEPDRYRPLTTPDVREAARLWAQARAPKNNTGGAPKEALDGDVLIAAQALRLVPAGLGLADVVVATGNVSHLSRLAPSALWSDIRP